MKMSDDDVCRKILSQNNPKNVEYMDLFIFQHERYV